MIFQDKFGSRLGLELLEATLTTIQHKKGLNGTSNVDELCHDNDFFTLCAHHPLFWGATARGEMKGVYSRKVMTINITSRRLVLRSLGTYWSMRV